MGQVGGKGTCSRGKGVCRDGLMLQCENCWGGSGEVDSAGAPRTLLESGGF